MAASIGVEVRAPLLAARVGEDAVGDAVEAGGHQHAVVGIGREFAGAVGGDEAVARSGRGRACELYWMTPNATWWLVSTRPSCDTKAPVAPPTFTTAFIGGLVRSARSAGSPLKPGGAQLRGDVGQLRGHPHAFVGLGGGGAGAAGTQGAIGAWWVRMLAKRDREAMGRTGYAAAVQGVGHGGVLIRGPS